MLNSTEKIFKLIVLISIITISCKKGSDTHCWNLIDNNGNLMSSVCDKTESEVRSYIKSLPGGQSIPDSNLNCLYYKVETDKYCWEINNKCQKNITTAQATLYAHCYSGTTPTKVVCDSCCTNWYNRYAYYGKSWLPTIYSSVSIKKYCGIGLDTIYQYKKDTILYTQDTLVIRQYSVDGIAW